MSDVVGQPELAMTAAQQSVNDTQSVTPILWREPNPNPYEGQWQYKLASANDQNSFVVVCNALGAKRWEMISLFQVHGMFHGYFKRPAFDNPEPHHLVDNATSGLDGVMALPRLPDADKRDERGLPIPVKKDEAHAMEGSLSSDAPEDARYQAMRRDIA